jgi:hypothetical protein
MSVWPGRFELPGVGDSSCVGWRFAHQVNALSAVWALLDQFFAQLNGLLLVCHGFRYAEPAALALWLDDGRPCAALPVGRCLRAHPPTGPPARRPRWSAVFPP